MFVILSCMKKEKLCLDCGKKIDLRSLRCYACRAVSAPSFKGKRHSDQTKQKISKASKAKFTESYVANLRTKAQGNVKRSINGYVLVKDYTHPNRNCHNDVLEHVKVMAAQLNRPLKKGEIVHHINGVRTDNRPENLFVFTSRSEHAKAHHSLNALLPILLGAGTVIFRNGKYIIAT